MKRAINRNVIHKQHRSSVWFTPSPLRDLARRVLGPHRIAFDPCTHASNPLGAHAFFTRADNALQQDWAKEIRSVVLDSHQTLWMNPPFGRKIGLWLALFYVCLAELPSLRAFMLVPSRVGSRWYRELTGASQVFCELSGRVRFEVMQGGKLRPAKNTARWGVTLVYFGRDRARVARMLAPFGAVRLGKPLSPQRARVQALPSPTSQLNLFTPINHCVWCGRRAPHHHIACPMPAALAHRDGCEPCRLGRDGVTAAEHQRAQLRLVK